MKHGTVKYVCFHELPVMPLCKFYIRNSFPKFLFQGEMPLFEILTRFVLETCQIMQVIATAISWPPELNGKILILKTSYTLATGHGEINLVLSRKILQTAGQLLACGMVLWGKKTSTIIHLGTLWTVTRYAHEWNSNINVRVIHDFLVGFKPHSTGKSAYQVP